jgi:DNA repair photolyase
MALNLKDRSSLVAERMKVDSPPPPRLFQTTGARVTPQVEWVEVQVKSVLNRVQGMPFRWSINPYRGCAHACVYCNLGDTRLWMADGTTKVLGEIRVGDQIYGTVKNGQYRRYERTDVLAHWSVTKPAFRVNLEDGTELIASGDHRFLSDRGWKFVTGAEQGRFRRPHLTTGNRLIGVGSFAQPLPHDSEYMRGYLCGVIRGDAVLAWYPDKRVRRPRSRHYRFRLALADRDALWRAREYLRAFSVPTQSFLFQPGTVATKPIEAIRTSTQGGFEAIKRIVEWPGFPSNIWSAGFLAGIFDAEGSYSQGVLRISNTDPQIIDCILRSLARTGFPSVLEPPRTNGRKPVHVVRVPGGLKRHMHLFHTIDPAISRKRNFAGRAVKSGPSLMVKGIEPVGKRELFDITTETGDFIANGVVSHNCFARVTHWYLDQDGVNDWSSRIFVKKNAPEVLRRELAKPTWDREQVHIGTATDPYQPAEGAYRITRQILEALRDFKTPAALVTKSTMIVRDRDILRQLALGPGAFVFFSITTVDPALAKEIEPDVPPPQRRLEAMRTLAEAGIRTGVLLAPVLPGITDDEAHLAAVVAAAKEYGASALSTNTLYLGDVTRQAFFGYLEQKRPELVPEYERLYRGKYAPRATQQRIEEVVAALKVRAGFTVPQRYPKPPETPKPAQVRLL